jgi:ParB family chromosome partitioning protein
MAGLGRGLDALISSANKQNLKNTENVNDDMLVSLPVDILIPGKYQPRQKIDEETLQELTESVKQQGIIQPIIVRKISEVQYEILAGERRWRAAIRAHLPNVPAIVKNVEDRNAIAIAIVENIQRKNLNVIEESNVLKRLIDEFSLTHDEVANIIGKSRAQVTNLLRLNDLESSVKELVTDGKIDMGHARALLVLDPETQIKVANLIVSKDFTVRETENYIRKLQNNDSNEQKTSVPVKDQNIVEWESSIREKIGCSKFQFIAGTKGTGKIVISYKNNDELENLRNFFNK